MGCKNGEGFQEDDRRSSSSIVNDSLLLTTIFIIGHPVDVHIKDGSVYSGFFYTACVDDHYAIVLKQARMAKKGSCDSNVANGGVIETLIIQSEDLVQVVAKRVPLQADGYARHETGDNTGAVGCTFPSNGSSQTESSTTMSSEPKVDQQHINQTRCLSGTENGFANGIRPQQASRSGNSYEVDINANELYCNGEKSENRRERTTHEAHVSRPSSSTGDTITRAVEAIHAKTSEILANGVLSDGSASSSVKRQPTTIPSAEALSLVDTVPSGASTTVKSQSCVNSSSTLTETVASKSSNSNPTTKEFKLNPRAKIFSPSFTNQRSATPPALPAGASMTYIPDNYPAVPVATAQPEVEIIPYAPRSSLPVKFVPYGNLLSGNGGNDLQHPPPIVGHMTNRTQAIRYGGQYHSVQTAPSYVHPSSQNVVGGRLGQLVYVHPVSQDMVPSTAGFSQMSTCSLLTPHQIHAPKHQGSAAAQALQLCVAPPLIAAGGQPPFIMPSHIPISQPPFPVMRPISVPGSNGFLGSKFS